MEQGLRNRQEEAFMQRETITFNNKTIHEEESVARRGHIEEWIYVRMQERSFAQRFEQLLNEAVLEIFHRLKQDVSNEVLGFEFKEPIPMPNQIEFIAEDARLSPLWEEASKINKKYKKLPAQKRQAKIKEFFPELPDSLIAKLVDGTASQLRGDNVEKENHPAQLALRHAAMNAKLPVRSLRTLYRLKEQFWQRYPELKEWPHLGASAESLGKIG
jgi:hypothetical protein